MKTKRRRRHHGHCKGSEKNEEDKRRTKCRKGRNTSRTWDDQKHRRKCRLDLYKKTKWGPKTAVQQSAYESHELSTGRSPIITQTKNISGEGGAKEHSGRTRANSASVNIQKPKAKSIQLTRRENSKNLNQSGACPYTAP